MARLADGDRDAATPCFEALWPRVWRFCASLLGEHDADDAAQQTMIALFAQAVDYDPRRSATAWALSIAWWKCRAVRTARGRRSVDPLDAHTELADPRAPADELLAAHERQVALRAAIADLSDADRAVIERALSEVADDPNEKPATLRKRKQRAIERLRRWFGVDEEGSP